MDNGNRLKRNMVIIALGGIEGGDSVKVVVNLHCIQAAGALEVLFEYAKCFGLGCSILKSDCSYKATLGSCQTVRRNQVGSTFGLQQFKNLVELRFGGQPAQSNGAHNDIKGEGNVRVPPAKIWKPAG